mgnify:CR=1 FL=1
MNSSLPQFAVDRSIPDAWRADLELAGKYACQGPRYTSYPTAPQFREDFPLQDYLDWQRRDQGNATDPLSLYVHIPFCHDICYYCACNKEVTRNRARVERYMTHLYSELDLQAALFDDTRVVEQLHLGDWVVVLGGLEGGDLLGLQREIDLARLSGIVDLLEELRQSPSQRAETQMFFDMHSSPIPADNLLECIAIKRSRV